MRLVSLLAALAFLIALASAGLADAGEGEDAGRPAVRVLTNSFVLPGKFETLKPMAQEAGVRLDFFNVEASAESPEDWLANVDLVILDVPRPNDRATVEAALGGRLAQSSLPYIVIGGGPPAWGGLAPQHASRLLGYYAGGGERNFRNLFAFLREWHRGGDLSGLPDPERLPSAGVYHPEAPHLFETIEDYLAWATDRWSDIAGRVAYAIHGSAVADLQTRLIDELVALSERQGLMPIVFWFEAGDPHGLSRILRPADADILVNLTHMQNGAARAAEFLELDIPVIQTTGYREGTAEDWATSPSGIPDRIAATFLAVPEGWGMTDPIVLSAVEDGQVVPLDAQLHALVGKLGRLVDLRRKPAEEKRLALLFWNYPAGEKNLGASNLNVPTSIENITRSLAGAGYKIEPIAEDDMIFAGQALLGSLYRAVPLEDLLARDLATVLPVETYEAWLASLPRERRHALMHGGPPASHWAVREIDGVSGFIIPRIERGNLLIMPQMPRAGTAGAHYHDLSSPPDHLYMAAYLYLRENFGADAIIHLGTHGTQEWLPGKDRGLAADDFPFLAVGDVPVFYPYIQDNVGEAIQAKRRGRAVIVSHQTPPFAPSGLYDELRDMHKLIHEYEQLDEGVVLERTGSEIAQAAIAANMDADLGWTEEAIGADFDGFLQDLHDHLHELAHTAMPLGLHTFGRPADPDHRLATVMQQLGQPFYEATASDPEELFVDDYSALRETRPFLMLRRYLREGEDRAHLDETLSQLIARAEELEANLARPVEIEALLAGLEGRFVAPGSGGDPIRNPDIGSGRNLYAFEPDKLPTRAAYEAAAEAFDQLIAAFREDHEGAYPQKLAFSLWSSEAIRHLGVTEGQILHALGLRPVWDEGGHVVSLEIIPASELGRPQIDVVIQVTSVYRDQFDGFMRLLAEAIERIAALDEPGNAIAGNTARLATELGDRGASPAEAEELAQLRIFSNAPGEYGSGLPELALQSTAWDDEAELAERFLENVQFAYGSRIWGEKPAAANLLAEQLRGAEAAIMSRSSNLHGVLSTDHPFEFLGGLSLAIRHLDGESPTLYIADLRQTATRTTTLARYLADELRVRHLNPHWIEGMQAEGYAGTLEMLNGVNNFFGWQVVDPSAVRPDQWQALFETYVVDIRKLGLDAYFETYNPTAQAQLIERMIEAIRKDYWNADDEVRQALAERWDVLATEHGVEVGEAATREFVAQMAPGYGLASLPMAGDGGEPGADAVEAEAAQTQHVEGRILEEIAVGTGESATDWRMWIASLVMVGLIGIGAGLHLSANAARANGGNRA